MDLGDITDQLIEFLEESAVDPLLYSVVFFIYVVLSNTLTPTPLEAGLVINLQGPPPLWVRALIVAAAMTAGASLLFLLGSRAEGRLENWAKKYKLFGTILGLLRKFVAKTRYWGLLVILSIPGMVDTVPLYLFSLFNKKGVLEFRYFAVTIFVAGILRTAIFYTILFLFGVTIL